VLLLNLQSAINGVMDGSGTGIGFVLDINGELITQILGELGQVGCTGKGSAESSLSFQNRISAGIASLGEEGGDYATS